MKRFSWLLAVCLRWRTELPSSSICKSLCRQEVLSYTIYRQCVIMCSNITRARTHAGHHHEKLTAYRKARLLRALYDSCLLPVWNLVFPELCPDAQHLRRRRCRLSINLMLKLIKPATNFEQYVNKSSSLSQRSYKKNQNHLVCPTTPFKKEG